MAGDGGWKTPTAIVGVVGVIVAFAAWQFPRSVAPPGVDRPSSGVTQRSAPPTTEEPTEQDEPVDSGDDPADPGAEPEATPKSNPIATVNISLRDYSRVGPDKFEAGVGPAIDVSVVGEAGLIDEGCYFTWKMFYRSKAILTGRVAECQTFFFPDERVGENFDDFPAGPYKIEINVETDDGRKAEEQYKFSAVNMS